MADGGGGHGDTAFTLGRRRLAELSVDGRLPGSPYDCGFHRCFPFAISIYVYNAHISGAVDAVKQESAKYTYTAQLRQLHGAVLDIVGVMNRPQRDEALIKAAGIPLDRALFPLLVGVERFGPIGVVELADRVGRDYTTVSRQVAKLESLGLVERRGSAADRRVREAVVSPKGKAMTDLVDAARDRIGRAIFENWDAHEIDELVRLMRKFADAVKEDPPSGG